MAKKDIPIQSADPEELAAEQRVEELMNPEYENPQPGNEAVPIDVAPEEDLVAAVEAQQQAAANIPEAETESEAVSVEPEPTEVVEAESSESIESLPIEETEGLDMSSLSAVESPETDKAVDDIMHKDADATLPDEQAEPVVMKQSGWAKFKQRWHAWWENPWSKYGTLVGVLVLIFVLFMIQPVRAAILNTFGVRTSMLVTVYDGATNLPLQNAVITVGDVSTKTNSEGEAKLTGIRLGTQTIEVGKVAFATYIKEHTFGMRIIDLGEVTLKPVGAQLSYEFTDYLSGKPVEGVQLTSGESTAKSNKEGKAILTLDVKASATAEITVKKDGYRTDKLTIPSDLEATTKHKLVPAVHAVYVTRDSGKYDVYKAYIDGKDRKVLLKGTGLERQNMAVLPSPDGAYVAVASSRDNKRNSDGYLLTALNIVTVANGHKTTIDHVESVELLGWRGTVLVYQQTVAGTSAGNPSRMKIIAYDTKSGERFQLANANSFGDATQLIGSTVYYTAHTSTVNENTIFGKVAIDATGKQTIQKASIWSVLRTGYDALKIQTPKKWYDYTVGQSATAQAEAPTSYSSRYYVENPSTTAAAWVATSGNEGALTVHTITDSAGRDVTLVTERNMQAPLYWLNDSTVVYRIADANEVADYAVNIDGGDPVKIAEVSLTNIR